jgi:hypothetical protein
MRPFVPELAAQASGVTTSPNFAHLIDHLISHPPGDIGSSPTPQLWNGKGRSILNDWRQQYEILFNRIDG